MPNLATDHESVLSNRPTVSVDVLDVAGLAALLRIPVSTILTLRSRSPERLPPPFRTRPLRWRVGTAVEWMAKEEKAEAERIARLYRGRNAR